MAAGPPVMTTWAATASFPLPQACATMATFTKPYLALRAEPRPMPWAIF